MAYSASKIECLRFAGRAGEGIGCCAIDLFQGFVNDPDAPATATPTHGDSGTPLTDRHGKALVFGPTNKDIFLAYLRTGTFSQAESPDRVFLAAITQSQCSGAIGKKWLALLKAEGFEFVRGTNNGSYGSLEVPEDPEKATGSAHVVYLFGLFRNISNNRMKNPLVPPQEWLDLPVDDRTDTERWKAGSLVFYDKSKIETGVAAVPAVSS